MLWPVVASAACCAFSPEIPMLISDVPIGSLSRILYGGARFDRGAQRTAGQHAEDLRCVMRIGRVTGLLQFIGKTCRILSGIERVSIAVVAAQQRRVIARRGLDRVVGAEPIA